MPCLEKLSPNSFGLVFCSIHSIQRQLEHARAGKPVSWKKNMSQNKFDGTLTAGTPVSWKKC